MATSGSDTGEGVIRHDMEFDMEPTNQQVLDIFKNQGKAHAISLIQQHLNSNVQNIPTKRSVELSVDALVVKQRRLNKSQSRPRGREQLQGFLFSPYTFPERREGRAKPSASEGMAIDYKSEATAIRRELTDAENAMDCLNEKLNDITDQVNNVSLERDGLVVACTTLSNSNDVLASALVEETTDHKVIVSSAEKLKQKLREKELRLKSSTARELYYRQKIEKVETKCVNAVKETDTQIDDYIKMLDEANEMIIQLKAENRELRDRVAEFEECAADEIRVFDTSRRVYSTTLHKCIYKLLEHRVGSMQVTHVIEAVLAIAGKHANQLPSVSGINRMNIERLALAQKQLGDQFADKENTCLLTDETPKFGDSFGGYNATDSDGRTWVLGLRQLPSKSAADTLDAFKDILKDVDEVCGGGGKADSILANISSTMSDRAATEKKFNTLLESLREEVLTNMDDQKKQAMSRLFYFFCGLHSLVHYAEVANSALKEFEKSESLQIADPDFAKAGESLVLHVLSGVCKVAARGGDEKSGCYGYLKVYLRDFLQANNLKAIPLVPYRGSRFNVVFTNAAWAYFLKDKLIAFLEGHSLNRLTRAVLQNLKDNFIISGFRALGLICYFFTSPLWCMLEDKSIAVTDMTLKSLEIVTYLADVEKNTADFMAGRLLLFGDATNVRHDAAYASLTAPSDDTDVQTEVILHVLIPAMAKLSQKLFADFLAGGCYSTPSEEMIRKTSGAPKHNKFSETVFGFFDQLLRTKPNCQQLAAESYIMFSHNRTSQWLDSKDVTQQDDLVKQAQHDVSHLLSKFHSRSAAIKAAKRASIEARKKKAEEAQMRKLKDKENITEDIIHYGLCQSPDQIDQLLIRSGSKTKQLLALKAQLRFREKVLMQISTDKSVYRISKTTDGKRVPLSVNELVANLKSLVTQSLTLSTDPVPTSDVDLVGKRVRHCFVVSGEKKWFPAFVVSQVGIS